MTRADRRQQTEAGADREVGFLRKAWWLFPVAGYCLAVGLARWLWYFVTLDASLISNGFTKALSGKHLWVVILVSVIPLLWWLGLRVERRWNLFFGKFPVVLCISVVAVGGAELLVHRRAVQSGFWQAVQRRSPGAGDSFARELASIRLQVLDDRDEEGECVVVAGSSQMIVGVDYELLSRLLGGECVKRRAIGGMGPLRMCAARKYLSARPRDTVVLYLSEYDMAGIAELDLNWLRPLASWRGTVDVMDVIPGLSRVRLWRQLVDLWLASSSELWRMRDYAKQLLYRSLGAGQHEEQRSPTQMLEIEKTGYVEGMRDRVSYEMNFRALERIAERFRGMGVRLMVFEGAINPQMRTEEGAILHQQFRERMRDMSGQLGFTYVAETEQTVTFDVDDWMDGTHLNGKGREKWTRYLAGAL